MQLNEDKSDSLYKISSYSNDFIRVNNTHYTHSLVLSSDFFYENWPPQAINELTPAHFEILLEQQPALVLLGTGRKLSLPPAELLEAFYTRKIGIEIMDTPAACRTMTILLAEKRNVIAGLILD